MSQNSWHVQKQYSQAPPLAFEDETETVQQNNSDKHMYSSPESIKQTSTPLCASSWPLPSQPLATSATSTTSAAVSMQAIPLASNVMMNVAKNSVEKRVKLPSSVSLSSFTQQKSDVFSRSGDGNSLLLQGVQTFMVGQYNLTACPICLQHFTIQNPAIIVKCQHGFHLQCLQSWRQRSNHCPLCLKLLDDNDGRLMNTRDYRRRRRYNNVNEVKMHLMLQQYVNRQQHAAQKSSVKNDEKGKSTQQYNISNINNDGIHNNNSMHHNENVILLDGEQRNWVNRVFSNFRLHQCIATVWHRCTSCCTRVDWRQVQQQDEQWNVVQRYLHLSNSIANNSSDSNNCRQQQPLKHN